MSYCLALLSVLHIVLLALRSSAEDYTNTVHSSEQDRGLPLAPGNLQYQVVDSTSVTLQWRQPASAKRTPTSTAVLSADNAGSSPTHQEAYILSFIIELSAKGTRTIRKPIFARNTAVGHLAEGDGSVPEGVGFENEYLLHHLKLGVEYTVRIAATNQNGIGPYSDPLTVIAENTNVPLTVILYSLMALVALVMFSAVGSLIILSRCPKRIVVVPSNGSFEGQSPDTNSTSKADYATEEGCLNRSRGHCNQFSDTKSTCEDGNPAAAMAITIESLESNSELAASKPNSDRLKADVKYTQQQKKNWPSKASFSQLLSKCHPRTVLGVHIRVNPVCQSTLEAKSIPWTYSFSETEGKEDMACNSLQTRHCEAERASYTPQHVSFIV